MEHGGRWRLAANHHHHQQQNNRHEKRRMAGKYTREKIWREEIRARKDMAGKESLVEIRSMKDESIATFHAVDMVNSLNINDH